MARTTKPPTLRIDGQSLALRLVLGATLWCALALVAGGGLLAVLFRSTLDQGLDARLRVAMDNLVSAIALDAEPEGGLDAAIAERMGGEYGRAYSGAYWLVRPWPDEGPPLAASRSLWSGGLPGLAKGAAAEAFVDAPGPLDQRLRTFARLVKIPGEERTLLLAVALDTAPLRRQAAAFQGGLAAAIGALTLLLVLGVLVQVRVGLEPLRALARDLGKVRDGRLDRLGGCYPSEIRPLADELNRLIAHNADVLARARTEVGNLAHALKTPLAVLSNEAHREEGALASTVRTQTKAMDTHVQRYLALARTAARRAGAGSRTEVGPVVADLLRTLRALHADRAVAAVAELEAAPAFAGERQDLEEMLGNLLDNAFKWAASRLVVRCRREGARLVLAVTDDGPGVPLGLAERLLERGTRLDETVPGSGLGLSIVQQIAEAYGGRLRLRESELGGLLAELELPAAEPA